MLLFTLLENGLLSAERGDVVVFNNTSCEHPETYRFAATCKEIVEQRYGIPFFWVEFQTYEDARRGEWARIRSYRLVNGRPVSEHNPHGFRWRGEVFEELLSHAAYVPNQFRRVTVATEHPAVLETVQWLGGQGFETVILPVDGEGLLDLTVLKAALDGGTLLVSVMAVNNEIGAVQPLAEVADLCRKAGAFLHTDATQAAGRMPVDVAALGVDLLSMSGHKVYGPNGIGALFVRARHDLKLEPLTTGGAQERGLRPGTVPAPLAVGLGAACRIAAQDWRADAARIRDLAERLLTGLQAACPRLRLFGPVRDRVPGNLNVGFPGLSAEEVIAAVSDRIAISTGAACASATSTPSKVLLALGLDPEIAATGVRISLGRFTTADDVREACEVLAALHTGALAVTA